MHTLLKTNVRRAFERLNSDAAEFTPEFQAIARGTRADFAFRTMTQVPIVYRRGPHEFDVAQIENFGFYTIRAVLRGVFRATNYLAAAERLSEEPHLFGPAIACAYTAAYHLLHSVLALEGRAIFSEYWWEPRADEPERKQAYVAILTRGNRWILEPRPRAHRRRWQEMEEVYRESGDRLPGCFENLFAYMYQVGNEQDLQRRIAPNLRSFLHLVADTRHEALYRSVGISPETLDEMINERDPDLSASDRQSEAFLRFAHEMQQLVSREALELLTQVTLEDDRLRGILLLSITSPDFDPVAGLHTLSAETQELITPLWDWAKGLEPRRPGA